MKIQPSRQSHSMTKSLPPVLLTWMVVVILTIFLSSLVVVKTSRCGGFLFTSFAVHGITFEFYLQAQSCSPHPEQSNRPVTAPYSTGVSTCLKSM